MSQPKFAPPALARNGSTPHLSPLSKSAFSRGRGSTVGSSAIPSSPLATISFSASSSSSGSSVTPSHERASSRRHMSVSLQNSSIKVPVSSEGARPVVKSRLRGLSVSGPAVRSGRGLMVLEGEEEQPDDFSDFSIPQMPISASTTTPRKPAQDAAISWWGQSDLSTHKSPQQYQKDSDEPLTSPDVFGPGLMSPAALKSFFDLPSPPATEMASIAPDTAPETLMVQSPRSCMAEGELPDLMSDGGDSPTSSLRTARLPDDVDDLHDIVKELRVALSSQEARFKTLSSSLQDIAKRSSEWKHALEFAQDVKIPVLERKVRDLMAEKVALQSRLQMDPEGEAIQLGDHLQEQRSISYTGPFRSDKPRNASLPVTSESDTDFAGPRGPRLSQILQQEMPSVNGAPPQLTRRGSLFSLPCPRSLSWSATASPPRGCAVGPTESNAAVDLQSETPKEIVSSSIESTVTGAEVEVMRTELQRLRARLQEATQARRASDDCLKALKEFIGEGAMTARSRSDSRSSLTGMKLPPLPTAAEEEEDDEQQQQQQKDNTEEIKACNSTLENTAAAAAAAVQDAIFTPITNVRSSLGSLFGRSASISFPSGQTPWSKAVSLPASLLPNSSSTPAQATAEQSETVQSATDDADKAAEATVPVPLEDEQAVVDAATAAKTGMPTVASAATPTLSRLGGWFRRPSIWEAPAPSASAPPASSAASVNNDTPPEPMTSEAPPALPEKMTVADFVVHAADESRDSIVVLDEPAIAPIAKQEEEEKTDALTAGVAPEEPAGASAASPPPPPPPPSQEASIVDGNSETQLAQGAEKAEAVGATASPAPSPSLDLRDMNHVPVLPRKNIAARARAASGV